MAAATSVHVVAIIELIILHANWFFPDGKILIMYNTFYINIYYLSIGVTCNTHVTCVPFACLDVDFNVSGMFAMPTGPTNQAGHFATPEPDHSTISRTRPGSQGASEAETSRKDRYSTHPRLHRQDSRSTTVSALYVVANETVTVKADSPSSETV